jgi:CubicO group peptidase (beta-lactamase class C family)
MVVAADSVGMDAQALKRVEELFRKQIEQELHPGAALAVYRHGQLVLDLYYGLADRELGKPVSHDTMFILYSSTKPLAAACLHLLWEWGKLDWDDPVVKHWPGFGKNGKEGVTIRHVLTHQGGFPDTPGSLTWKKWHDWDAIARAMEDIVPEYQPGEVMAYHPRNFGWVIGELVRRIDGRLFNQFLSEEITMPLGMNDAYVGLPPELEDRVSRVHAMDDCDRPGMIPLYNKPEVHQAVQPSGGGITTARDLARFYAMMGNGGALDGAQILKPETVAEVTGLQIEGIDYSLGQQMRRGLGLVLTDYRMGASPEAGRRTFGHGGAGTSIGWADPDLGLAVAFITNGFRCNETNNPRLAAISQAVREACL